MYVLTGASGHVGNAILRNLICHNANVKILVRREFDKAYDDIKCIKAIGDIRNIDFLKTEINEADIVIHCAGIIDITDKNKEIFDVNVGGTKNILDVSISKHASRFIYISSVDAISCTEEIINIPTSFDASKLEDNYGKSKAMATNYVLNKIKNKEIEGTIIYPSSCIGLYDFKCGSIGDAIKRMINHKLMATFDGKYNFVDVLDVAEITYLASIKDQPKIGYMATNQVVTVKELIHKTYDILEYKKYPRNYSYKLILFVSHFVDFFSSFSKKRPLFNSFVVKMLQKNCNFNNQNTISDLNFTFTNFDETLKNAIEFYRNN